MTYIEHMNQLWRSALLSPMPASEIALFAYLVNEINKRYWKMPFACSTTRICERLAPFKANCHHGTEAPIRAQTYRFYRRQSRHLPSNYTLLEWTDNLTVGLTDNLTHGLTQDLTHIKDKDKHQSKDSFIKGRCEIFDSKNGGVYGNSKRKENRRTLSSSCGRDRL